MSVFSGMFDPTSWLQEKTLSALKVAVHLVDLANEPDTSAWYRRKLLYLAKHQICDLAPVTALLHGAGQEAADRDEWGAMLESGSFALGKWCKKWKIGSSSAVAQGSLIALRTVEEHKAKAQELSTPEFDGDPIELLDMKLQIYSAMSRRLLYDDLPATAQRLLLYLLGKLWLSDQPDQVVVSKKFLPTDIGVMTADEALGAYRTLYERGLIERVELRDSDEKGDRLSLRLVVEDVNESRHAVEYKNEKFGFPGARINGKVTTGQIKTVELSKTLSAVLGRWFKEPQELNDLRDQLQTKIGDQRIFIERTEVFLRQFKEETEPALRVQFRFPIDADMHELEEQVEQFSTEWLKEKLIRNEIAVHPTK